MPTTTIHISIRTIAEENAADGQDRLSSEASCAPFAVPAEAAS